MQIDERIIMRTYRLSFRFLETPRLLPLWPALRMFSSSWMLKESHIKWAGKVHLTTALWSRYKFNYDITGLFSAIENFALWFQNTYNCFWPFLNWLLLNNIKLSLLISCFAVGIITLVAETSSYNFKRIFKTFSWVMVSKGSDWIKMI